MPRRVEGEELDAGSQRSITVITWQCLMNK